MTTRLPRRRVVIVAVSLLLCAFVFGWTVVQVQQQVDENAHQSEQIDALAAALAAEQEAAEDRGETPVAPDPSELLDDPSYEPEPGPQGDPGPGPSDTQVYAAVAAYFTAHPVEDGEDASPAAIAAAVANYLAENPPEKGDPGSPPSGQQVADAVEAYLIENPPPAGPPGADGEDASPEAIAAEVAAYIETHPLEECQVEGYSLYPHTVITTDGPVDQIDCVSDAFIESQTNLQRRTDHVRCHHWPDPHLGAYRGRRVPVVADRPRRRPRHPDAGGPGHVAHGCRDRRLLRSRAADGAPLAVVRCPAGLDQAAVVREEGTPARRVVMSTVM